MAKRLSMTFKEFLIFNDLLWIEHMESRTPEEIKNGDKFKKVIKHIFGIQKKSNKKKSK